MPSDDRPRAELSTWLSKRAGLVILVVIAVIVAMRLMSSWLRWLMIAIVAGAIFHVVKSRLSDGDQDPKKSD